MKTVLIIGSGISGLSFAYYLQQAYPHLSIIFLEKEGSSGGWVSSIEKEGFSFPKGPRFFEWSKSPHMISLIQEIGLEEEIVFADSSSKKRYIYEKGALQLFPTSFSKACFSPLTKGLFYPLIKEIWQKPKNIPDETVHDFIMRRFRSKKVLDLATTLLKGVYAAPLKELSLKACFPQLHHLEETHGSIVKGFFQKTVKKRGLFGFKSGIDILHKTLKEKIQADFFFHQEVRKIAGNKVFTKDKVFSADSIVIATPQSQAEKLLLHPSWKNLPLHSLHIAHVGFHKKVLPVQGFGYLTSAKENSPVLGAVFDSCMYPSSQEKIAFFLGGALYPKAQFFTDEKIKEVVQQALKEHLKIGDTPDVLIPVRGEKASVILSPKREKWIQNLLASLPKQYVLLGNYFSGVSVEHSIERSVSEVHRLMTSNSYFPN